MTADAAKGLIVLWKVNADFGSCHAASLSRQPGILSPTEEGETRKDLLALVALVKVNWKLQILSALVKKDRFSIGYSPEK